MCGPIECEDDKQKKKEQESYLFFKINNGILSIAMSRRRVRNV